MESTVYFESNNGNGYLYDMQNSCIVNCHPVFKDFMKLSADNLESDLYAVIQTKYPSMTIETLLSKIFAFERGGTIWIY